VVVGEERSVLQPVVVLEERVVVGIGEDFGSSPATHCWLSAVVLWALV
jgi:hypothetical protein